MDLTDVTMLFTFIGGLGMFLYGMHVMAEGIQRFAGERMRRLMGFLTKNRLMGVLVGAVVTAVIQSSAATTVMVVGFVNAGMLTLTQSVGVIMGANIGTTVTAWIVSMSELGNVLQPSFFAPLVLGIGALVMTFSKSDRRKQAGEILVGFAILFIGLSFMSNAIAPYRESPVFVRAFSLLGRNPLLGILVGTVVTAVIQSSSVSIGILQMMALNGIVSWRSAVFIILGQNIGSCVTVLLSGASAGRDGKRASVIQLMFNLIGAGAFGVLMYVLFLLFPAWGQSRMGSVEISAFHTAFNVLNTVFLLPFTEFLVTLSGRLVPEEGRGAASAAPGKAKAGNPGAGNAGAGKAGAGKAGAGNAKTEGEPLAAMDAVAPDTSPQSKAARRTAGNASAGTAAEDMTRRLDPRILQNPSFALVTAEREVASMGETACQALELAQEALRERSRKRARSVYGMEGDINGMEKALTAFLVEVDNLSLTEAEHEEVKNLFYTVSDLERVGDHAENIARLAESMNRDKISFSKRGRKDMELIFTPALQAIRLAVQARENGSSDLADSVEQLEDTVDLLRDELREKHIRRLSQGKCKPESGVIFLDVLTNLERVADHAMHIADYVRAERRTATAHKVPELP